MRRRAVRNSGLGLFVALAVLVAPGAANAFDHQAGADRDAAARITGVDGHAPVVHVAAPARKGHERRAAQRIGFSFAAIDRMVGVAPAVSWAGRGARSASLAARSQSSAQSRAPPAVV